MKQIFKIIFIYLSTFADTYAVGLEFYKENIYDTVSSNQTVYPFKFEFINNEQVPIKILNIETSCECTNIKCSNTIIRPKEHGYITGIISLHNQTEMTVQIKIITDNLKKRYSNLTVKLNNQKDLTVKPKLLRWSINASLTMQNICITGMTALISEIYIENKDNFNLNIIKSKHEYILEVVPTSTDKPIHSLLVIKYKPKNSNKFQLKYIHLLIK